MIESTHFSFEANVFPDWTTTAVYFKVKLYENLNTALNTNEGPFIYEYLIDVTYIGMYSGFYGYR